MPETANKMKTWRWLLWYCWLLCITACVTSSERNALEGLTRTHLDWIDNVLRIFSYDDVAHFETLDDFLRAATAKKYFDDPEKVGFDGWGHKFNWLFDKTNDRIAITIISAGKNGVFENGNGDDIVLEFVVRKP
jgi:hypothetical protein